MKRVALGIALLMMVVFSGVSASASADEWGMEYGRVGHFNGEV